MLNKTYYSSFHILYGEYALTYIAPDERANKINIFFHLSEKQTKKKKKKKKEKHMLWFFFRSVSVWRF